MNFYYPSLLQVFAVAMKSIRYAAKNVQEMSRELAAISAVTAVTADLAEKLHSAEQMKAETEARLNEKVKPRFHSNSPWAPRMQYMYRVPQRGFPRLRELAAS